MSVKKIKKRNGVLVNYNSEKISNAIKSAFEAVYGEANSHMSKINEIVNQINAGYKGFSEDRIITVEEIQDDVEKTLMRFEEFDVAKSYIIYRKKRSEIRKKSEELLGVYKDLIKVDAKDNEIKRENANIDGDTAMGTMLKFGSEGSKLYYETDMIEPRFVKAHQEGLIHIHDEDFYALTLTCCQIDLLKLLKNGFSTGHGYIREPNDIRTYSSLACIAIQSNQNDQHGGQSIPNFDFSMAPGVAKTFIKETVKCLDILDCAKEESDVLKAKLKIFHEEKGSVLNPNLRASVEALIAENISGVNASKVYDKAYKLTKEATFQAMEALIHNLNTMHSRAGAQVPFSSLNYGTDTTEEGRLVMKAILQATWNGLGGGETPIFPIQIFKVKDGISGQEGDINYDLFKESCRVSAKRLFPNFSFLDAPFNAQYYQAGKSSTEAAYMGCRTRVLGNTFDPKNEITFGRGNLSFTSVNLPRMAILSSRGEGDFWKILDDTMDLVCAQLLERFEIQAKRRVKNYPFLMGQGVWIGSDALGQEDEIREVIKHGTLSVGFIGLAECLAVLTGKHHGESKESWDLGEKIISHMRQRMDDKAKETGLNFSLLATPAEGLSGRFINKDRAKYGVIAGVTDKGYYTNSFHIPVGYHINAFDKIALEAPFHELTNAGHITYVEMDGDPGKNLEAFEQIVQAMKTEGIGYGAINHPVDRCPVCGYVGIINDECPGCHRHEGEAVLLSSLPKLKQEQILGGNL
ncbi:MAG: anaerobic ribonucleoside triphosphate reductase [Alphaproteobacteria bacterium]